MRLKKKKEEWIDLKEYVWPDAFLALKAYIIFCYFKKKYDMKNATSFIHPNFVKDVLHEMYDDHECINNIKKHPQKEDLHCIEGVKIYSLLKSNPYLLLHLV